MRDLQIERAEQAFPGTHWRPIARMTLNGERLNHQQLRDELSAREYTDIAVEDPYRRGHLLGDFVINRGTLVVAHRKSVATVEGVEIGPLSVVHKNVRLPQPTQEDETTTAQPNLLVGTLVELQPGVVVTPGVRIGDRTAVLKGTVVKPWAHLSSVVFAGSQGIYGPGSRIGTGSVIEKDVQFAEDVSVGRQVHVQRAATVFERTTLDDGAQIGRHVRIHPDTTIGEAATIGHYTVVEEGAIVGAEAVVGDFTHRMPGWVLAGQYIPGRHDTVMGAPREAEQPRA